MLSCINLMKLKINGELVDNKKLEYKDENSGEYECEDSGGSQTIYVKFRSESRAAFLGVFCFIWSQETCVNYECV